LKTPSGSGSVLTAAVLLMLSLAPAALAQEQDLTPPVTTLTPIDTDGDGFITGAVLNAADPETGIKEVHWFIDGGPEQFVQDGISTVTLGPFSAEPGESKTVTIQFFSENNADTQEDLKTEVHPVDACPDDSAFQNGNDVDADNDGCPELETNLCEEIQASGLDAGIKTSLVKKCLNAEDSYARGRDNAGNNMLQALIGELNAQRGQGVPAAQADAWIDAAEDLIVEHGGTVAGSTPTGAVVAVGGGSLLAIAVLLFLLLRGRKKAAQE
jgi:hypothetical protein